MKYLIGFALLAQSLDVILSCHEIHHGGKEINPLLPKSCLGLALVKSAGTTPLFILRHHTKSQKIYAGALIGSGIVGVSFTLMSRK